MFRILYSPLSVIFLCILKMMWIVSTDGRQGSQGQTYWSDLSLLPTKYLINIDQPDVSMSHIILRAEQEPLRSADNQETVLWELTSYE